MEESLGGGGCLRVSGVDLAGFPGPSAGLAARGGGGKESPEGTLTWHSSTTKRFDEKYRSPVNTSLDARRVKAGKARPRTEPTCSGAEDPGDLRGDTWGW